MHDVVDSWIRLQKSGIAVPDYALVRVAGAYLTLHRPVQPQALYRELVRRSPDDDNLWSGLAYAEFESEHIRTAF